MSVNLLNEPRPLKAGHPIGKPRKTLRSESRGTVHHRVRIAEPVNPRRPSPAPSATCDDESRIVTTMVLGLIGAAVAPLILFYALTFFFPDIFMIPLIPD